MNPARFEIEFAEDEHKYRLNGKPVPSVTTILSHEGLSGSAFWKESDRQRGTAVHRIALLIGSRPIKGSTAEEIVANSPWDPLTTSPALVGYGLGVARFYLESGIVPKSVECRVGSLRYSLAGTLDGFGQMPTGERILWDFKSGIPQESAHLQTAGYCMMLEETYGVKVDLRTVVQVMPTGEYKMLPPRPVGGTDLSIFLSAVSLYHWRARYNML